jgi:hypothetical protein
MAIGSPQWMYASGADDLDMGQSLRFSNKQGNLTLLDAEQFLTKTPSSAGNRRTWTFSAWVKRGNIGSRQIIFASSPDGNTETWLAFESNDKLWFKDFVTSVNNYSLVTNALFRDPGAWYHIVVAWDTTQSTASNRMKLYVNGVDQSDTSVAGGFSTADYPTEDFDGRINNNVEHTIGRASSAYPNYMDGYLSEVNFIDGQALGPAKFGRTGDYGEWVALEYNGNYGNNGFRLPFNNDYTVEGFSVLTYPGMVANGTTGTNYVGGVGFSPDLVWIKKYTSAT